MRFVKQILSFFLPEACVSCRLVLSSAEEGPFCPSCREGLRPLKGPLCTICGDPYPHEEIAGHVCGKCLADLPNFEWARSVFEWGAPLSDVIHRFKYQGNEVALSWFADRMEHLLKESGQDLSFDFLVPVPLHPFRLLKRGYNQALLLTRALQKKIPIPMEFKNLVRRRYEKPQSKGGRDERLKQIKGAFSVRRPSLFEGKKLLLVDDVYTTGSTLRECAQVLKKTGAIVCGFTLARTLLKGVD